MTVAALSVFRNRWIRRSQFTHLIGLDFLHKVGEGPIPLRLHCILELRDVFDLDLTLLRHNLRFYLNRYVVAIQRSRVAQTSNQLSFTGFQSVVKEGFIATDTHLDLSQAFRL